MTDRPASATEALIRISAALAAPDPGAVDRALTAAKTDAVAEEVEETLLQSYLFLGYPAALNAIGRWRELGAAPPPEPAPGDYGDWERRGRRVCERVYGTQFKALRHNLRELHPDMEQWTVVEGYGKVLGRPGLPLVVRELCIVALLAVLDVPRQLYSHLRGALNVGAAADDVSRALTIAGEYMTPAAAERAGEVWADVRARVEAGAPPTPGTEGGSAGTVDVGAAMERPER